MSKMWSKEQLENIMGRKLLDWEYERLAKYLNAKKENPDIKFYTRRQSEKPLGREGIDFVYAVVDEIVERDEE